LIEVLTLLLLLVVLVMLVLLEAWLPARLLPATVPLATGRSWLVESGFASFCDQIITGVFGVCVPMMVRMRSNNAITIVSGIAIVMPMASGSMSMVVQAPSTETGIETAIAVEVATGSATLYIGFATCVPLVSTTSRCGTPSRLQCAGVMAGTVTGARIATVSMVCQHQLNLAVPRQPRPPPLSQGATWHLRRGSCRCR
jgi:hypothetical protein